MNKEKKKAKGCSLCGQNHYIEFIKINANIFQGICKNTNEKVYMRYV